MTTTKNNKLREYFTACDVLLKIDTCRLSLLSNDLTAQNLPEIACFVQSVSALTFPQIFGIQPV